MKTINYTAIRENLNECYDILCQSERDRLECSFAVGKQVRDGNISYKENWYYPDGRKRKRPVREVVWNMITVTEEMFEEKYRARMDKMMVPFQVDASDAQRYGCMVHELKDATDETIEALVSMYKPEYREHLLGFKANMYDFYGGGKLYFSYVDPVFDNDDFWAKRDQYIKDKAGFCDKYGCE